MDFIVNFLMFFGFLFLLIISTGLIVNRQKKKGYIEILFILSFIVQGFFILMMSLYLSGLYPDFYWLIMVLIPVSYLFSPLWILRYLWLFTFKYRIRKIYLVMFLPSVIAAVYCAAGFITKQDVILADFLRPRLLTDVFFSGMPAYWKGVYYLITGAKFYLILAMFPSLFNFFTLLRQKSDVQKWMLVRIGYIFAVILGAGIILSFLGDFFYIGFVKGAVIMANFSVYLYYIVSQSHSDYSRMIKIMIHKVKYKQSCINGMDIDSVINRLYEIMELEKAFADEDISLKSIADELGLTTHQLSQILNEKIKKNFRTFVNEFRIEEAKRYLIEERGRTILSISGAVGFNSYVTFCTTFLKMTGVSPSQFRKDN